jgi:hypothetical protein
VLGLSITSAAARLVVVEGTAGEGETVGHHAVDIDAIRTFGRDDARGVAELLFENPFVATDLAGRLRSIGVVWTDAASAEGTLVLQGLADAGFDNFIAVSQSDAVATLAKALKDLAGSTDVAACIVEPEEVLVATVSSAATQTDRIARIDDDIDELVRDMSSLLQPPGWTPDTTFVLGSADDLDLVVALLQDAAPSSIVSAAEADGAMARGAALAAAWAISGAEPAVAVPDGVLTAADERREHRSRRLPKLNTRVGALTRVLVAAVLTFVVSVSAALGLRLTSAARPSPDDQPPAAAAPAAAVPAPDALPSPASPPPPQAPPAEPPPLAPETIVAEAASVPDAIPGEALIDAAPVAPAPVYGPMEPAPPANVPPEPAYVAPPPTVPDYAAPAAPQPQPQPRLRDRIIEKIPIINRIHEPKPQ